MPDEPTKLPPKTEALAKGVETETEDRVRRIDTLTAQINKLQEGTGAATRKISKDVSTVTEGLEETKAAVGELKGAPSKDVDVTVPAMNNVLKRLGDTMGTFAIGIKRITADTARATKNTISQYGKAISEDISINRQNVIAMSLAKATPLFGYFAAKFMETDVFRDAAAKIKSKVSEAFSSVASRVGEIFRRKKETEEGEIPKAQRGIFKRKKKTEEEEIPKAQRGAYVERAGVVKVHPAEVIAPIDKILEQIGKQQQRQPERLVKPILGMSRAIYRMERSTKEQREGLIKSLVKGIIEAEVVPDITWQEKLLEVTIDIKTSQVRMRGFLDRLKTGWERMLVMHPVFRTLIASTKLFGKLMVFPAKFAFKARGGYTSDIRKALRTPNVMQGVANLLALIYGEGMFRLDQLVRYTRGLLEFQTGRKAGELKRGEWSIARKALRAVAAPIEWGVKKALPKKPAELLTEERGVGGHLKALLGIKEKKTLEKTPTTVMIELLTDISGHIQFFRNLIPKQERKQLEVMKDQAVEMKKSRKGIFKVGSKIGGLTTRIKRMGSGVWKWMIMGISILTSSLRKLLSPSLRMLFKLIRRIPGVGAAARGIGAAAKVIPKVVAPVVGLVSGALAKGGLAAAGVWGAGALAAGAIGYGIGTLINKAIDWGFGEKGGLGKWFHDWVHSDAPKKMWEGFLSIITWPFRKVKEVFLGAKEWIAKGIDKTILAVANMVLWPFDKLEELFTVAIIRPLKKIEDLTGIASETVVSMITWPFRKLKDLATGVTGWVLEKLGIKAKAAEAKEIATKVPAVAETVDAVSSLFTTPITKIKELFVSIKDTIVGFVTTGISKVGELPGKIWDDISQIPTAVTNFINSGVTKVKELTTGSWDKVSEIKDGIINFFKTGIAKITDIAAGAWRTGSKVLGEITSFFAWPFMKIAELLKSAKGWVWEKAKDVPILGTVIKAAEKMFGGRKKETTIEEKAIKVKEKGEIEDEIREEISKVPVKAFRNRLSKIAEKRTADVDLHPDDLFFLKAMKKKYGIEFDKGGVLARLRTSSKVAESVISRIVERSDLAKREATNLLLEGKYAAGEFGKTTNKVMERMTEGAKQTNAAIMYNTNVISTVATNMASTSSIGAGGGSQFTEFSSGDQSVLDVVKCNIP